MPDERKTIVIDRETTFHVRYGTKTGVLVLNPICGMTDCILLLDCTGHVGSMRIEPDPVAEAVQAETERCKAIAARELGGRGELRDRDRLLDALDAPPEPVSEYERGRRAMHWLMMDEIGLWKPPSGHIQTRAQYDGMTAKLASFVEPTDAH